MISRVANVVIPISDCDRAAAFYGGVLGFELRADFPMGPGARWVEVGVPGSVTTIALATPRGGMWRSVGGDTNINLSCLDIVEEHARLRRLGVDVDDRILELADGIPRMFQFRDPDGNSLHVVEDLDG